MGPRRTNKTLIRVKLVADVIRVVDGTCWANIVFASSSETLSAEARSSLVRPRSWKPSSTILANRDGGRSNSAFDGSSSPVAGL